MKIALTGTSSTGKTTLMNAIIKNGSVSNKIRKAISADARTLLDEKGFKNMDIMTRDELLNFQKYYFLRKSIIEKNEQSFITDRSYIDVAAYWLIRDTFDKSDTIKNLLIGPCKKAAQNYTLHFYLPHGLIQFVSDGYRSEDIDFHKKIDEQIKNFLYDWKIDFISLNTPVLAERIEIVIKKIQEIDE